MLEQIKLWAALYRAIGLLSSPPVASVWG